MKPNITLILGGACSGKSAYASSLPVTYIATAQVYDAEFQQRMSIIGHVALAV